MQLIRLVQEWSCALDDSHLVGVVFFDIKKAFDRVWLPGLLHKLKSVGVQGKALAWFRSYLVGHCQRTAVGRHLSATASLHAGVPQGAVLSPLLFSLYMNDIVQCTDANVNLFADDTSVYVKARSTSGLQVKLQTVIDQLASWFGSWALTVNQRKSALLILTTRRSVPTIDVSLAGAPIQQVVTHKHLGLTLDCRLSWSQHTSAVLVKALQEWSSSSFSSSFAATRYSVYLRHMYSSCTGVCICGMVWCWRLRCRSVGAGSTRCCSFDRECFRC